jgi:hypothetical protein
VNRNLILREVGKHKLAGPEGWALEKTYKEDKW